jgi:hypothetical protein
MRCAVRHEAEEHTGSDRTLRRPVSFTECSRGCFPDVSMVQSADPCQRFQFRPFRFSLNRSPRWCVLIQSEMSSILMVVRKEFTAQPPYVRFI